MNENDMIAEYIKERMPELLTTCDFALYRLGVRLKEIASGVVESAMQIDWDAVWEKLNEEQPNGIDTWKQQTMSRFERVE
jgi:hypothetical protein